MSNPPLEDSLEQPHFTRTELANLCGAMNQNLHLIEQRFEVLIKPGKREIRILGRDPEKLKQAKALLSQLHPFAVKAISNQTILGLIDQNKRDTAPRQASIHLGRKHIQARNAKQQEFLKGIDEHDLSFAVGPAGTGKTYLAVAKAIESYERGSVQRLIFARPAVEAGEKLGFLPGDLVEKVLPYLRPIYDALYEMLGFKECQKLIQNEVIEILPLAFMRGRTLNEAFIILDEAQNTSPMQMKMFLTRIGFGSKTIVTGDMTQIDLPKGSQSGLSDALALLRGIPDIGIYEFTSREVVRHPLVAKIIDRYEGSCPE